MDTPLSTWYCDVCRSSITDFKKGYVIWKSADEGYYGFKIIHQRNCDQKDHTASAALEDFLGARGLSYCMSFLSLGPVILNNGSKGYCKVRDFDEFADFVRRVQVPYYEQARRLFSNNSLLADYSDTNELYPYIPENLQNIIKKY